MKIIIFLDLQKNMCDFIIDPKFFKSVMLTILNMLHIYRYTYQAIAIIRDIDTDANL
jgi:hypothetical protein